MLSSFGAGASWCNRASGGDDIPDRSRQDTASRLWRLKPGCRTSSAGRTARTTSCVSSIPAMRPASRTYTDRGASQEPRDPRIAASSAAFRPAPEDVSTSRLAGTPPPRIGRVTVTVKRCGIPRTRPGKTSDGGSWRTGIGRYPPVRPRQTENVRLHALAMRPEQQVTSSGTNPGSEARHDFVGDQQRPARSSHGRHASHQPSGCGIIPAAPWIPGNDKTRIRHPRPCPVECPINLIDAFPSALR